MAVIPNALAQSHQWIGKVVVEGDTVVDATCGNGNDTLFLAGLVGQSGRVYAFDIQAEAIERARMKLQNTHLSNSVVFIHDGHQNLNQYVGEQIKAVMFNLGYLPGGDHTIGTKPHSTIVAVGIALDLITKGGLVTIVVYYGGDSGFEEKEQVMEYLKTIDCRKYTVMTTEFANQINSPPILICIERIC